MFPARYLANTLICLMGSVQSVVIGFAMERDLKMWKIGLDLQLLTIVYSVSRRVKSRNFWIPVSYETSNRSWQRVIKLTGGDRRVYFLRDSLFA